MALYGFCCVYLLKFLIVLLLSYTLLINKYANQQLIMKNIILLGILLTVSLGHSQVGPIDFETI
jgi:hypothetical protein